MSKTLADMTAEERASCVGMWADTTGQGLGVIVNATKLSDCWVLYPGDGGSVATCRNKEVTPRYDLPRSWASDGKPVEMKKERGYCEIAGLETTVHKYGTGTIYVSEDTPHGEVYRWIGEWEEDNELL